MGQWRARKISNKIGPLQLILATKRYVTFFLGHPVYVWSFNERFQWILQKHKLQHDARIVQDKLKEVSASDIQSTFVFF